MQPEPPLTAGRCAVEYEKMAACYCLTWTCIRTDTLIPVIVYSSAGTLSRVPTAEKISFISPLSCKTQSNLTLNAFCLLLSFTFIAHFPCQLEHTCSETSREQPSSLNRQSAAPGTRWCRCPLSPQRTGPLIWISARGSWWDMACSHAAWHRGIAMVARLLPEVSA